VQGQQQRERHKKKMLKKKKKKKKKKKSQRDESKGQGQEPCLCSYAAMSHMGMLACSRLGLSEALSRGHYACFVALLHAGCPQVHDDLHAFAVRGRSLRCLKACGPADDDEHLEALLCACINTGFTRGAVLHVLQLMRDDAGYTESELNLGDFPFQKLLRQPESVRALLRVFPRAILSHNALLYYSEYLSAATLRVLLEHDGTCLQRLLPAATLSFANRGALDMLRLARNYGASWFVDGGPESANAVGPSDAAANWKHAQTLRYCLENSCPLLAAYSKQCAAAMNASGDAFYRLQHLAYKHEQPAPHWTAHPLFDRNLIAEVADFVWCTPNK
jgi:hypothetical protein